MKNDAVISAWLAGRRASTANLSTDGLGLWSYNLKIGDRSRGNTRIFDYTASGEYISQTTSRHVGMAIRATPRLSMELIKPK